ncbi:hypothetical protein Q8F57_003300 [Paraburkholderia terrae]|uniref:hypothetical protein n=1 Tax=Paraburkholderia terrae TaxID=311230 RepID=UPI00296AAF10|nr:hypothetical protein [Paraburkholderia terrae]MDW3655448.1 hypothetical protein [Paraburkholderia terrae]
MSKGTIRFPESAIVDGRIGRARISAEISSAAARLASVDHEQLDASISRMVGGSTNTPRGHCGPVSQSGASLKQGNADKPELGTLEAALAGGALTPVERMQLLGRGKRGKQNKTETAYENEVLKPQLHIGEILWYRFEAIKLRLADNTFITIDFPVITAAGQLEFREVKGRWTDDARAKTKVAAAQYPFRFLAIQRDGRHGWRVEDLTSRSW